MHTVDSCHFRCLFLVNCQSCCLNRTAVCCALLFGQQVCGVCLVKAAKQLEIFETNVDQLTSSVLARFDDVSSSDARLMLMQLEDIKVCPQVFAVIRH
jgi:hypothetical protein